MVASTRNEHTSIASFTSDFIQTEAMQVRITRRVQDFVESIKLEWSNRKKLNLQSEPYTTKTSIIWPHTYDIAHESHGRLDDIAGLAREYWEGHNLHHDKAHRPCDFKLFVKAAYRETTLIFISRIEEAFKSHDEIRISERFSFKGQLHPNKFKAEIDRFFWKLLCPNYIGHIELSTKVTPTT